jgi:hypothetical protein
LSKEVHEAEFITDEPVNAVVTIIKAAYPCEYQCEICGTVAKLEANDLCCTCTERESPNPPALAVGSSGKDTCII